VSVLVRVAAAGAGLGLGTLAYAGLVERRWYRLRRLTVPGALRRGGTPLRILHVSDVHLVPGQDHRVRFLASLADLDHDLVVATGDLLGAEHAEDAAVDAMAPLTAGGRPGLVVLGSNDVYGPVPKSPLAYLTRPERRVHGPLLDTQRLVEGLADVGYRTLSAGSTTVETAAGTVVVGSMEDPHLDLGVIPPVEVLRPTVDDAVLHLGLVHSPYLAALDRLVEAGHDLLLSGHTHGGQLRVPGVGALVTNCDLPRSQARGLSRHRGAYLHVSAGLGHSRYAPVRFACRPEATLLELTG
jgi:uncharacterized protein